MTSANRKPLHKWQIFGRKDEILAYQPQLQALAQESLQEGSMDFLAYFLSAPYFLVDVPHASLKAFKFLSNKVLTRRAKLPRVLLRRTGTKIDAAVFVFEYSLHGIATGCFVPADSDGYRTVIASPEKREEVTIQAGKFLLKRGALLLLLSYMEPAGDDQVRLSDERPTRSHPLRTEWPKEERLLAHQVRELGRRLPLEQSFEATLAGVSRNTRHNLRRSMQQARRELGVEFMAEADLDLPALQELARESAYGPPHWAVQERFDAVRELPGGVLAGLRGADGQWISVVGGHREHDALCLDWQLNRSGAGVISVATAMRGFLIESEIGLGTRSLRFESGTTHPLQRAFLRERSHDLLFAGSVLPTALLKRMAAGISEGGPLATVLRSGSLVWRDKQPISATGRGTAEKVGALLGRSPTRPATQR